MKRAAIALLLLLLLSVTVFAHPGNTDANGGHYDRSTGEYHYHHGYPAHQHTGGKCPYNFVDKTGENSGTSGGSSSYTRTQNKNGSGTASRIISFIYDAIAIGWGIIVIISASLLIIPIVCYPIFAMVRYVVMKIHYTPKFKGKDPLDFVIVPEGVELGIDGLPKEIGSDGWGSMFTVYTTEHGLRYHKSKQCIGLLRSKYDEEHIYYASKNLRPCSSCCSDKGPDLSWYAEYLEIKSIKSEYNIK